MLNVTATEYLQALYGKCSHGDIVFVGHTRNYVTGHFPVTQIESAAKHIEANPLDLFIKVNVMDHTKTLAGNKNGIGGKNQVEAIVSFHLDVDASTKNGEKYTDQSALIDALGNMPLVPSNIILTDGPDGGLHAYWLLDEPHYITDEADRTKCGAMAQRWLEELRLKVKAIDENATVDGTADLCRLLRPIGSKRKNGNRVDALKWNPERRYKLEEFALPDLPGSQPAYDWSGPAGASSVRTEGENIIEQYLDTVGKNTVEAILFEQGYDRWKGSDRFLIRSGSSSGVATGEIFTLKDGRRGFTVKSGAASPLSNVNSKGANGNWYSVAALWVTFKHNGDWKKAAKECYDFLRPPDVEGIDDLNKPKQPNKQPEQPKGIIKVRARRMNEVAAEKINWWWPGKIPRANLIIFAGQGGCGKSSVCCDLVARHTTGKPFPNDFAGRQPENVAIINCEDDAATIQRPRLDAAGADCSRVHLLDDLELNGNEAWIDFSNFAKPIEDYVIEHEITLLVIDPISGHIGGKKQNDTAEVREVLQKLQAIAKRTGCTIIAITHSPKAASSAQGAVIGSQAFVSCARAAFAFVVDKEDPKRRIMLNAKNNYSADETGLAYRIEDQNGVGRVEWEQEPVTEHPDTFFAHPSSDRETQSVVDKAATQLSDFLTEPKPKKEIDAWAKAQMISNAALRRAKDKNGHHAEKRADGWYWLPQAGAKVWQQ